MYDFETFLLVKGDRRNSEGNRVTLFINIRDCNKGIDGYVTCWSIVL